MKKSLLILVLLVFMLMLSVSGAMAGGKGDGQPEVSEPDGLCNINAGPYGLFQTDDAWYAEYSNGRSVLKCLTNLHPWQTPPAEKLYVPSSGCANFQGDITTDAWKWVFPDGRVSLICRFK